MFLKQVPGLSAEKYLQGIIEGVIRDVINNCKPSKLN